MGVMAKRSFRSADGAYEVRFSPEAWETMLREASEDAASGEYARETGGILIGSWNRQGRRTVVTVRRSSGPGPESVRERCVFSPDLEHFRDRSGYYASRNNWRYLGEWHRHPGDFHALSGIDLRMASELLRDEKWPFLLLPVLNVDKERISVTASLAVPGESGKTEIISLGRVEAGSPQKYEGGRNRMKAFVNSDWIERFANGQEDICEYKGFRHPGESWVFLPLPGIKNATLRLVRQGIEAGLPDTESVVTVVVNEEGEASCFTVREGEVREIPLAPVRPEEDVYQRNSGILETRELAGKKVFLAGCGSVGSTMALELVRAGVGALVLADPDILEPANVCRHQAGLQHLGRRKADAVRDMALSINPSADVEVHAVDICGDMETMETISAVASQCDLLLCTTDTDESRIFVNDLSISTGVPSIQVGLHERAVSGIVQIVRPGESACFLCHRERVLRGERTGRGAVAYSDAEEKTEILVSPGLSAQINAVAEIGVLRALELLRGEENKEAPSKDEILHPDLLLLTMRPKNEDERESLKMSLTSFGLEPSAKCPACGDAEFDEGSDEEEKRSARSKVFSL